MGQESGMLVMKELFISSRISPGCLRFIILKYNLFNKFFHCMQIIRYLSEFRNINLLSNFACKRANHYCVPAIGSEYWWYGKQRIQTAKQGRSKWHMEKWVTRLMVKNGEIQDRGRWVDIVAKGQMTKFQGGTQGATSPLDTQSLQVLNAGIRPH